VWVESENGRKPSHEEQGGQTQARKTTKICFYLPLLLFFFFFLPSLYYHYDDYDMMHFLAFYFYSFTPWEEQGGSCFVLFGWDG